MTNFFQKKVKKYLNFNHINLIIVLSVLTIAAIIPIVKTYGKLNIGHDTLVPLVPQFSYKMAYQWNDIDNGSYFSNNYFIWLSIFSFFTYLGLSIYQTAFIFQFLIFFLSGLGVYKIYNLFNNGNKLFALLPAIFIIISPHYLDHHIYYLGTVGIIWACYFLFKFIKFKEIMPVDIVGASISLGIISDLPNPKYHFLLLALAFFVVIMSLIVRVLSLKNIADNAKKFALLFFSTLYISLPFVFFGYSFFHNSDIKINVKQGYQSSGVTLDYGYALISKMVRLFHTPSLNPKPAELISRPFFSLAYYIFPILVLGLFPIILSFLDKYSKRIYIIFYTLILLFLFISKSSNPPFGFMYEYLLTKYGALAFMRTTSGVVIFVAIFYVLIFGRIFQFVAEMNNKFKIMLLIFLILIPVIVGYPIWSGQYFLNISIVNNYIKKAEHGIKIPYDYFRSSAFMKNIDLDTKIDVYPYTLGYQNNNWGYYGFELYPLLIDKPMISFNKKTPAGMTASKTNSLYIYHDKTLEDNYSPKQFFHVPESLVFMSSKIDIYKKKDSDFLPHFYNKKLEIMDRNIIEYKKINPTKYRVVIHHSSYPFLLTFTDNFHPLWKVYLKNYHFNQDTDNMINQLNSYYKNPLITEVYRANKNDILNYVNDGSLTTLGDMKLKNKIYYEYHDEKILPTKSNYYYIDYISINNKGTIQNNNLPNGNFHETFPLKEMQLSHIIVNGYANGWIINPKAICVNNVSTCLANKDGSYDLELIVEFWPQKLANISYTISSVVIISLILYHIITNIHKFLADHQES